MQRRRAASARAGRGWRDQTSADAGGSRSVTTSAPTRCAKWTAIAAAPVIGDEVAEHPREVGNRQPRARVPHRRPDENLRVDEAVAVVVSRRSRASSTPPRPEGTFGSARGLAS